MTTNRTIFVALALAGLTAACMTGRSTRRGGLPAERVAAYPTEIRESYELFAARCSRCHTLSRPLNAQIDDYEHWYQYVERMRHHAGSGISKADSTKILVFLRHYTDERRADVDPSPSPSPEPPPPPAGAGGSGEGAQGAAR